MMSAILRKNLAIFIWKQTSNSAQVWKTPSSHHFFSNSTETQISISPNLRDTLRNKYCFPPRLASRIVSELSRVKSPQNADSILCFFKESGFSNSRLQKIVKNRPRVLAASLDDSIRPKIKILGDMGFSSDDSCRIISTNPGILYLSVNDNIIPSLSVLKGFLGSDAEVARFMRKCPRILTASSENTFMANVEFLKSCSVATGGIRSVIISYPNAFLRRSEVLREVAEKVKEMGVDSSSRTFAYAISTVASTGEDAWELKLQAFKGLGFSESDILSMFGKKPHVFLVSIKKMKKMMEFLLGTRKFGLSCICPTSLMYSFEKRLKPRVRTLKILESRNLIETWPSLRTFCTLSDAQFFERFGKPRRGSSQEQKGFES